jgi:hypothetical protein
MFILIFGIIFTGDDDISFDIGLVNEDGAASAQLVEGFKQIGAFDIHEGAREDELEALEDGDRAAVIVIPAGTGELGEIYAVCRRGRDGLTHTARRLLRSGWWKHTQSC